MRSVSSFASVLWGAGALLLAGAAGASVWHGWGRVHDASIAGQTHSQTVSPASIAPAKTAFAVLSNEEWLSSLSSERHWRGRKSVGGSGSGSSSSSGKGPSAPVSPWNLFGNPSNPFGDDEDDDAPQPGSSSDTYRTVCVRLCDGYFFPISFSTTRDRFGSDEATCQNRCSSDAKLYVYRNPGGDHEVMVDIAGRPYSKLSTAFLYRTAYDASCKCNPHPWEQEARLRHRVYALEVERRKGSRKAVAELRELKASAARSAAATGAEPDQGRARIRSAAKGEPQLPQSAPADPGTVAVSGASASSGSPVAKLPAAALEDVSEDAKPLSRSQRRHVVVSEPKALPKPMSLGASGGGGDWRRKALNPGY